VKALLFLLALAGTRTVSAAYECQFALSAAPDYDKVVAVATAAASETEQTTRYFKQFHLEAIRQNRPTAVALSVLVDGWRGAEEINLEAFRRREARTGVETAPLGEKITLRGEGEDTFFLDAYRLRVSCRLT
jgi:hypothetical protein